MSMIAGKNLSIGYEKKEIVGNIFFNLKQGDYLCVIGENGAGKSTFIKTLLGLLPPVSGEVIFGDGLKRNEIGYLPQHTYIQKDFPASVMEIVLSGCQGRMGIRPYYSKEEKKLAKENMEKMGISDYAKKSYRELSGGQQQRVLLARALCATQKLLLLDEPVAGLDPNATAGLYKLIEKLHQEGITIIMISHDITAAIEYGSHILYMAPKSYFGTKEAYIRSSAGKKFLMQKEMEEMCRGKIMDVS